MRTIDIFISSSPDVQKEHAVAGQLIRSAAAEFNLPINVHYSNPLRGSRGQGGSIGRKDFADESALVLCPCFWEYPELQGDDFLEQIPNTAQYDLVICILWSRLGTSSLQQCVMPDGSRPRSATEYEVAWALDQSKRTPGFPELHVYRNRATPTAPLEPKEKLENLCRGWDAVQEFCAAWEKNGTAKFRESCHDYRDLEEFADLFRQHFRGFLAGQLDRGIASKKALPKVPFPESNPFRGLDFFDFEDAAFYHGRIKAVGEILDALKNQAKHKTPFVLVLGQKGSGKSSLVRAGVLPLLTQGGTALGNGPWRHAVTRPGAARDPFDTLAAALGRKFGLPELQDSTSPGLASQLREDPDVAVARIAKVLNQPSRRELDEPKTPVLPAGANHCLDGLSPKSAGQEQPKMRLALVVDQLEELFTGVSLVLQEKYVAALVALANCEGIFTIATLRSDFFPHCQRFPELLKLISFGGRYELQPPTPREIGNMIRFPAEATGLRFEQNPETGRTLDETILKAAISSPDQLPLLQHLLSRLYQRQLERKDGLLLWSDYRQLGELRNALAQHAEFVFSRLNRDEQQALKFVTRQLLARGRGGESLFYRRTVPYRDLVASPKLNQRQRVGAKGLVDRLINEGLLSAENDPEQRLLISVPQEVLLRRWPRLWQSLSEDPSVVEMRDRVEARLRSWLIRGFRGNDLLHDEIGLAEAQTLLRDFKSSLSETQIDYIQKSLVKQKRRRRVRYNIGLGAIIAFAAFAVFMGVERFNVERRRNDGAQDVRQTTQNADLATSRQTALETELKKVQAEKAQLTQQNTDLVTNQRNTVEVERKEAQEKLEQVQVNLDRAVSQLSELQAQLTQAQEKVQKAQAQADLATSQRSALETELKKVQAEKAQLTEQNTDLVTNQRNTVEVERKEAQEKLEQAQVNSDRAASQLSELQAQLKQEQEKVQKAQADAGLATSRQTALETELKKVQAEKAQLTQQNTDLVTNQRNTAEVERKEAQEKLEQVQVNSDRAASQLSELQAQLKQEQEKVQKAQADADLATSQRRALETELKKVKAEKAQLTQQNTDLVTNQRTALETQLKEIQEKLQLAQQNFDLATSRQIALETELKKVQAEKAQLTQQNTDLVTNQRNTVETERKEAQDKLEQAQVNSDRAASQLSELQAQLKQEQEKVQKAQADAGLATSRQTALETELKKMQAEKAQLTQQNTDLFTNQQTALETQLKEIQEKLRLAQQNFDLATSRQIALETELKKVQAEKAQLTQQNTDLVTNQRNTVETERKEAQDKLEQAQVNSDRAVSQLSELQAELKQEQEKVQKAQADADLATSRQTALETELKKMQAEKTQLKQLNTDLVTNQRSALETQLKEIQEKLQLTQQNADLAASRQTALETELKKVQAEKAQLTQQNTDLVTNQRSALETQLKEIQGKLQLAQLNADLATSRQTVLETELKKVQVEKAQLTQQVADLIAAQEHPLGDGPTKREAVKKVRNSANELRSGLALTLDPRQNAEQGISTQGFSAEVQPANH